MKDKIVKLVYPESCLSNHSLIQMIAYLDELDLVRLETDVVTKDLTVFLLGQKAVDEMNNYIKLESVLKST